MKNKNQNTNKNIFSGLAVLVALAVLATQSTPVKNYIVPRIQKIFLKVQNQRQNG